MTVPGDPVLADPAQVLKERFGFERFNPGQREVIDAVLSGDPTIAVMPTGAGKSLCYQLPALVVPGVTLVVSPLIALMKDQVDSLNAKGIPATFINSSLDPGERRDRLFGLAHGAYELVYVAPERFRSQSFVDTLRDLQVGLFAVDEAHCISQWGHDFRPDYTRLDAAIQAAQPERVLACTATATEDVRKDIAAQLGLGRNAQVFVTGFLRENLHLSVQQSGGKKAKLGILADFVAARKGQGGVVYCSSRRNVEAVWAFLDKNGHRAVGYHAGMPDHARTQVQDLFMARKVDVVVATNAFGMGVDRSDIRFVVHHDPPRSVEAYYQEVGRAGRDGLPSDCLTLFNHGDVSIAQFLIDANYPEAPTLSRAYDWARATADDFGGIAPNAAAGLVQAYPDLRIELAADIAFRALEKAGYVEMLPGGAVRPLEHPEDPQGSLRCVDFPAMEARRDRERTLLRRTVDFMYSTGCRHAQLLGYFGDRTPIDGCETCDNCERDRLHPPTELTEEQRTDVLKALSCIARMRGRFGKLKVVQVLQGSRARDVLNRGLDNLSTYGLLKDHPKELIQDIVSACVDAGYARVAGSEYPTIALTDAGWSAVKGEEELRFRFPAGRKSRRTSSSRSPSGPPETLSAEAAELFEALRNLRSQLARAEGVPAYAIFNNRALEEMARVQPRDADEMLTVHGVGARRLERYGEVFLEVIASRSTG